jgi:ParB/RepB/Spo0J family partition protein
LETTQLTLLNWNRAGKAPVQAGFFPVENIEEAVWNPNEMPELQYQALKEDMKQNGPNSIDPLMLGSKRAILEDESIPENVYIVLNGNHRLKAARELGWKEIKSIYDPSIQDEATARLVNHNKNFERGQLNPYKEAELINFFLEKRKYTQEKVASALHMDVSTVRKRLTLLKIDASVSKEISSLPLSVSHAEQIAKAPVEVQQRAVSMIRQAFKETKEAPSVEDVARVVQEQTHEVAELNKLKAAVEKSEHKTCPTCKKPAAAFYAGYYYSAKDASLVICETKNEDRYSEGVHKHVWDLKAGKTLQALLDEEHAKEKAQAAKDRGKKGAEAREKIDYVRTTFSQEDFNRAFATVVRELIPKFTSVEEVSISGMAGKSEAHISYDYGNYFDAKVGDTELHFTIEEKEYKVAALKQFKTLVRAGTTDKKKLAEFEQKLNAFMKKYAGVAPPTTEKKLTKKEREAAKTAPLSGFSNDSRQRNRKG